MRRPVVNTPTRPQPSTPMTPATPTATASTASPCRARAPSPAPPGEGAPRARAVGERRPERVPAPQRGAEHLLQQDEVPQHPPPLPRRPAQGLASDAGPQSGGRRRTPRTAACALPTRPGQDRESIPRRLGAGRARGSSAASIRAGGAPTCATCLRMRTVRTARPWGSSCGASATGRAFATSSTNAGVGDPVLEGVLGLGGRSLVGATCRGARQARRPYIRLLRARARGGRPLLSSLRIGDIAIDRPKSTARRDVCRGGDTDGDRGGVDAHELAAACPMVSARAPSVARSRDEAGNRLEVIRRVWAVGRKH